MFFKTFASMPASISAKACARLGRIKPGEFESLTTTTSAQLQIVCGLAWITLNDDPRDYWLSPNTGPLTLKAGQRLLIEAAKRGANSPQAVRWVLLTEGLPSVLARRGFFGAGLARKAASIAKRAQGSIKRGLSIASVGTVQ